MLALASLASEINRTYGDAIGTAKHALDKMFRVGELLAQAKRRVRHGEWESWIRDNLKFGERQAQNYMQLFESRKAIIAASKSESKFAFRSLDEALAVPREP